jgi:hypothetical protein
MALAEYVATGIVAFGHDSGGTPSVLDGGADCLFDGQLRTAVADRLRTARPRADRTVMSHPVVPKQSVTVRRRPALEAHDSTERACQDENRE